MSEEEERKDDTEICYFTSNKPVEINIGSKHIRNLIKIPDLKSWKNFSENQDGAKIILYFAISRSVQDFCALNLGSRIPNSFHYFLTYRGGPARFSLPL